MDLLAAEVAGDEPGQQVVLDRLLDLALIATLRAWFARPEADAPGWYRAHGDPLVGPPCDSSTRTRPGPWTVAGLAAATGASRAAFARRFTALVGQPPMTYLTHWRLDLAADPAQQHATVAASPGRSATPTPSPSPSPSNGSTAPPRNSTAPVSQGRFQQLYVLDVLRPPRQR